MSTYHFRPARRSAAKMLIGVFSLSGRGKTYSALLVARGFVGAQGRIGMIETESGRGEIYQGVVPEGYGPEYELRYDVTSIAGSFAPEEYGNALTAAEAAKLDALVIDSASHEWESVGGVLDMAAERSKSMKGPLVWQKPKMEHAKHFVLRLMASPIPLIIVNMRAKYPMEEVTEKTLAAWRAAGGTGKPPKVGEWVRSRDLEPKQSEDILYEMLIHGWIDEQHRFHVTKFPQAIPELRNVVQDNEPLSIQTGERLAKWAASIAEPKAASTQASASRGPAPSQGSAPASGAATDTLKKIDEALGFASETLKKRFAARLATASVKSADELAAEDQDAALTWLKAQIDREAAQTTT